MATLSISSNVVLVTCNGKALGININRRVSRLLEPPFTHDDVASNKDKRGQSVQNSLNVDTACLSTCGRWMVMCMDDKHITLWKTEDWTLVSSRVLLRTASNAKFTPSGRSVVVADKSGDAYLYSVDHPEEVGTLLLGHLSMLLDILVTNDEKHIITCDRDEKIRVSNFPNCYNVEAYCLGHEQFVSCISQLPHASSVLVSSSGDGTVRFWDYVFGTQLHVLNCGNVSESSKLLHSTRKLNVSNNNPSSKSAECYYTEMQDQSEMLPVRSFTSHKLNDNSTTLCVCVSTLQGCYIYTVFGSDKNISSNLVQTVKLQAEPWTILFSDKHKLWTLVPIEGKPADILTFDVTSGHFEENSKELKKSDELQFAISEINDNCKLFKNASAPLICSVLYKRKFDNMKEYQERKKLRQAKCSENIN